MRNPYVTGTWVSGTRFYGRAALLDHLLHGPAHAYWLIGNRRIGKTSTLRQLEAIALAEGGLVPLFVDLQGCESFLGLAQYLADAVYEESKRYAHWGVKRGALPGDAVSALKSLRRSALLSGDQLFLLCDESEALLRLARSEPEVTQRLHHELITGHGMRVVMASTRTIYQMQDICADWPTSPFLEGFDLSQTLGSLSPAEVRALASQLQAPQRERVGVAAGVADEVAETTGGHPYLVQILCARLFQDSGALRPPEESDLAVEPMLRGFFNHDFNALTEADRKLLLTVHAAGEARLADLYKREEEPPAELGRRLHNLENLGYLRRIHDRLIIGNRFLAHWLSLRPESLRLMPAAKVSEAAVRATLSRQEAQEVSFLASRLNQRRTRLVELESCRAREMLAVDAEILHEIAQVQDEIRHLRRLLAEIQA